MGLLPTWMHDPVLYYHQGGEVMKQKKPSLSRLAYFRITFQIVLIVVIVFCVILSYLSSRYSHSALLIGCQLGVLIGNYTPLLFSHIRGDDITDVYLGPFSRLYSIFFRVRRWCYLIGLLSAIPLNIHVYNFLLNTHQPDFWQRYELFFWPFYILFMVVDTAFLFSVELTATENQDHYTQEEHSLDE